MIRIGKKKIGEGHPPLVVAEMSSNHNQSLARALEITEAAAKSGAHALKLQTYTADTITLNVNSTEFEIDDHNSLWAGKHLYELYQEASTPWEWHEAIFSRANELGMLCFSTPFDDSAVDFLEQFDPPVYKISSFENNHFPLVKKVAATGKPIIVSTGLASEEELSDLVKLLRRECLNDFVLLKCTSAYPANPHDSNLQTMVDIGNRFGCDVGLSDHTLGIGAAIAAVALGACMIEKHFTIRRDDGSPDAPFSLEPDEMETLVKEVERAFQSLGKVHYGPTEAERPSLKFRRSIYVSQDVGKGELLTTDNLRVIRPGFGLAPKYFPEIVGRIAKHKLRKGKALKWEDIE